MRKFIFLAVSMILLAVSSGPSQTTKSKIFRKLMVQKLESSQKLLEGIALADYEKITQSAQHLLQISNTAEWFAYKTARYHLHSNEFRAAAEKVIKKAKGKNLDGVVLAYMDLTMSCVHCHQYVREIQEAKLIEPQPGLLE